MGKIRKLAQMDLLQQHSGLLKFCYLMVFMTVLACAEKKESKVDAPEKEKTPETKTASDKKKIMFFGDSLTAGMGLSEDEAFPAVIQGQLDSIGLPYEVINAGLSGETTASGKNRLDWVLNQEVEIFVLELGANDGLRGIPIEETRKNLQEMIDMVREKYPNTTIVLAGMMIPPNMGPEYTKAFQELFPQLASKNDIALIPFLLDKVAGISELNQNDGIHPTAEGHQIVAENVWKVLEPIIKA